MRSAEARVDPAGTLVEAPGLILRVVSVAKRSWRAIRDDINKRKRSVRYDELVALLEAAGFGLARSSGSHRTFTKPGCPVIVTLKDSPGHVRIGHVTTTLASVEECGDD